MKITESLAYRSLERQNTKLWQAIEERDDTLHEIGRHLKAGNFEAAKAAYEQFSGVPEPAATSQK